MLELVEVWKVYRTGSAEYPALRGGSIKVEGGDDGDGVRGAGRECGGSRGPSGGDRAYQGPFIVTKLPDLT